MSFRAQQMGTPEMMGRRRGYLHLMKADNPDIMTVHCVIDRVKFGGKEFFAGAERGLIGCYQMHKHHKVKSYDRATVQGILPYDGEEPCSTSFIDRSEMVEQRQLL